MTGPAYYNEIDPYAAQWLRNLISAGHIAPGDVDERSIVDVRPDELRGYRQCHFFAGIGGWSYAARLAGWPDDRPLWTGSCPCQPFSVAGKGEGADDRRHLWPVLAQLVRACRPPVLMGEQVAAAVGKDWLDGVYSDLESIGYACGAAVVPACAVDAPHRRDRLWFVAHADKFGAGSERAERSRQFSGAGRDPTARFGNDVANPGRAGLSQRECQAGNLSEDRGGPEGQDTAHDDPALAHAIGARRRQAGCDPARDLETDGGWPRNWNRHGGSAYVGGADGKARRVEPGIRLLAHGVPNRVGKLRAYGNAIVPAVAAEIIASFMEVTP